MRPAVACAIAAVAAYLLTPVAIRIATRTGFVDRPGGYKGHARATPYLGGTAIMLAFLAGIGFSGGITTHYLPLVLCAIGVWLMGTVDDKFNLPILPRVCVEAGVGVALARTGLGWTVFHQGLCDTLLSVFWVVAVMNAFNLMDNMDGASATTACVSALGAGTLAIVVGRPALAPLSFATAGACAGFLPYNLAKPARVFMGDGGSLPLGLLIAASAMTTVNRDYFGPSGVVIGALLVGLVIYTAAYIAEVVRSGILAVPKGQWEAAGAIGMHRGRVLRLVVLPQALRVIIPPLTSEYLNLTKNSSLAVAIGFQDIVSIANTTLNQTGQAIEGIAIIMGVYLTISLSISALMGWYERHTALVTR